MKRSVIKVAIGVLTFNGDQGECGGFQKSLRCPGSIASAHADFAFHGTLVVGTKTPAKPHGADTPDLKASI